MPTATNLMTARSLRTDLPYRVPPDELELDAQTEAETPLVTEPPAEPTASETPPAEPLAAEPPQSAPLTKAQVSADAAFLSRELYAQLVKQHGEALATVVDHDVLQLLARYRATSTALITVEYYSNAGTFFLESTVDGQQGSSLYEAVSQIQTLQKQGALPGLEKGMAWRAGYIRLSAPGCRPVLLLPSRVETEAEEQ